jgi:hypothetical protein
MDKNIRLLWAYDHPTTRYQEVNLFIDSGVEVVVSLGDPSTLRHDKSYHDETHALYPDWRASLTLPASIVERIRRIDLFRNSGHVSSEHAELINSLIDIMIIPADAPVIANIMSWYKGHLLYRLMGAPNLKMMQSNLVAIGEIAARSNGRLWLGPGLKNLIPWSDPILSRDFVTINAWVSPERMHHSWTGANSAPEAATAISYIDNHPFFQEQFATLKGALNRYPFIVLGKNDKRSPRCVDAEIIGTLPTEDLHTRIANARVFIDSATVPEHLIWPPMEAMAMGVPTLYTRWSGLAAAGFDDGNDEDALSTLGMFDDFDAIDRYLAEHGNDIDTLAALAERQKAAFIDSVFSRDKARAAFEVYRDHIGANSTRDREAISPDMLAKLAQRVRRQPLVPPTQGSLGRLDGPSLVRTQRLIRPAEMRARTGQLLLDGGGQFVRRCVPGHDEHGAAILEVLPDLPAGHHVVDVALNVVEGAGHVAKLYLKTLGQGDPIVQEVGMECKGPGFIQRSISFAVAPGSEGVVRELILIWHGEVTMDLLTLRFRTAG